MVLLVLITIGLAVPVGVVAISEVGTSEIRPAVFSLSATPDGRIVIRHTAGPELNVRELSLQVTVDGTALRHQPPVPFFAAAGFRAGPTGPFNIAAEQEWTIGESASVHVASTNSPTIDTGTTVTVRIFRDDVTVAVLETTV